MDTLPPYVTAYTDRHGTVRYRFRQRGKPSKAIPGRPGGASFEAGYQAALRGEQRKPKERRGPAPGTMRAAWLDVCRSIEWQQLKASSKTVQIGVAERFFAQRVAPGSSLTFGQMPIAGLRRGDIKKIMNRYSQVPHAGEAVLRLLRKLCLVALDAEWILADPTYRVKFPPKLIGHRAWTDAELAAFEQRWPVGTKQRLSYALALYTGQRRSDVARMAWGAFDGNGIAVIQDKTGAPLWIPAHPALREILDAMAPDGGAINKTAAGNAFTTNGFGNMMADAIGAADLPDACRLHGLRKSAGRCLAEAGATTRQIMAILGHKTLAEAERYTRGVEQKHMAQQGIEQWAKPRLIAAK